MEVTPMADRPVKKLVTTTGKYINKQGEEKNTYHTLGKMLKRDDGSFYLKIDSLPLNFSGWVNLYELDEERQQAPAPAPVPQQLAAVADDDIPF
jgi:hypothetical protein